MKTYLDCIPCFFRQALDAAKMSGADQETQKIILDKLSKLIPSLSLIASPPEIGREVYQIVNEISGKEDPFKEVKERSNKLALALYPKLKEKVRKSSDKLLAAVELAIAGNVIDYGVKNGLDIEKEIEKIFTENEISVNKENQCIFDYDKFKNKLSGAKNILYLADNAGEVVFDKILIEELAKNNDRKNVYVVKNKPVINDALMEDAMACGVDKYAQIITNGGDAPGTVLKYCSQEFINIYKKAEIIISKGQGNFESLSDENKPIFFLFKVKCPVVAKSVNGKLGDGILKSNL